MKLYSEIDEKILLRHLELAYLETLEKKYIDKNFKTYREYQITPNINADFVAINNNEEMFVYEIKLGKLTKEKRNRLYSLKKYIEEQNKNIKFKMVFLNYPQTKEIEFDELQDIIFDHILNNDIPHELDILSTHTRVEGVNDIEIVNLEIKDKFIYLQGNGVIEVSLQYGSDSEAQEDDEYCSNFPFEFKITLNSEYLIEDSEYTFDTDSFYE